MDKDKSGWDPESIKRLREIKGLSTQQVARAFQMRAASYEKYETGERTPSVKMLIELADFFDVSLDYLVGRCETKTYRDIATWYKDANEVMQRVSYRKYLKEGAKPKDYFSYVPVFPFNLFEKLTGEVPVDITDDQISGLEEALSKLTDREEGIVRAYYQHRMGLAQAGIEYGICADSAQKVMTKALQKLKYQDFRKLYVYGLEESRNMMAEERLKRKMQQVRSLEKAIEIKDAELKEKLRECGTLDAVDSIFTDLTCAEMGVDFKTYIRLKKAGLRTSHQIAEYAFKNRDEPCCGLLKIKGMTCRDYQEIKQFFKKCNSYEGLLEAMNASEPERLECRGCKTAMTV